jgi:hypothetical protein
MAVRGCDGVAASPRDTHILFVCSVPSAPCALSRRRTAITRQGWVVRGCDGVAASPRDTHILFVCSVPSAPCALSRRRTAITRQGWVVRGCDGVAALPRDTHILFVCSVSSAPCALSRRRTAMVWGLLRLECLSQLFQLFLRFQPGHFRLFQSGFSLALGLQAFG